MDSWGKVLSKQLKRDSTMDSDLALVKVNNDVYYLKVAYSLVKGQDSFLPFVDYRVLSKLSYHDKH